MTLTTLVFSIFAGLGAGATVLVYIALNPEKIEVLVATWWRMATRFYDGAHKKYVKHDLQGRVNSFTKSLSKRCPELHRAPLKIDWVDATATREAFLADGKVVLRLRRDDPQDYNFVHGVYHYVSTVFLHRAKTYLTKTQRISIDIFTCTKLIENQKVEVIDFFIRKYLHPLTSTRKGKVTELISRLAKLYDADLFFPVFIQELEFLGLKIFGRQRDDLIHQEVSATIDVLEVFSDRQVGDEGDHTYLGSYCKFAVVIVGKSELVKTTLDPYVKYLKKMLEEGCETLYLLGPVENATKLEEVCLRLGDKVNVHRQINLQQTTRKDEKVKKISACLFVVRSKSVSIIQPPA